VVWAGSAEKAGAAVLACRGALRGGAGLVTLWIPRDAWSRLDRSFTKPFFESSHPLARALAPLRSRPVRPGELLLALCVNDAIEAELGSQLLGLWHRAEELSSRGLDFDAVAEELARSMSERRRERDVPPPRNLGQLPVLTVHGSKGLEFKHVILVDFGEKPARASNAPLLFWDRERGAYLGARTDDGSRDKDSETEWREEERLRELSEVKRVFYVALTRAQERLVLACLEPAKAKKEAQPGECFTKDFWRAWVDEAGGAIERISAPDATRFAEKPAFPDFSKPRAANVFRPRVLRPRQVKHSRQQIRKRI
jgi:hypothetical protein